MNTVNLIGNLVKDPDATDNGNTTVCRFTLAINEGFGENKRTDYIPIVCFGKTAENCGKFLRKGQRAAVTGRLEISSYVSAKTGEKKYATNVVASRVEFLEPKPAGNHTELEEGHVSSNVFEKVGGTPW